ncbi:Uncharacterised protein [Vibrio cholerae]|nr:Uncharacterised protein [Vibrio cholerae]
MCRLSTQYRFCGRRTANIAHAHHEYLLHLISLFLFGVCH